MSADPTAERIDAVACVIGYGDVPAHRTRARTLLTTASADAHAALAASLPAEVMLAALVDRLGSLRAKVAAVEAVRTRIVDNAVMVTEGPLVGRLKVYDMLDRALATGEGK